MFCATPAAGRGETSISPAPLALDLAPLPSSLSRLETLNPEDSEEDTAWLPVLHQDTPSLHPPEPSTKPTVPSTSSWLEVEPPRFETIKTINPTDNYSDLKYNITINPQKDLTILPTEPSNSQYSWNVFNEKPLHFSSADIVEPGDKVSNSWLNQNVPTLNEEGVSFPSDRDTNSTHTPEDQSFSSTSAAESFSNPPPAVDTQGKFSVHLTQAAMHEATSFGLNQMRFLFNVTEPTLYQMGESKLLKFSSASFLVMEWSLSSQIYSF